MWCRCHFSYNLPLAPWFSVPPCTFCRWWDWLSEHTAHKLTQPVQIGPTNFLGYFSTFQINPMDDIFIFVNVIIYFCCASSQTWLNCHFGSCLSHETEGITHAIYSSPWMDRNEQCKRGVRILVERSRRPMTIYAGGLFELSLPTFVSVSRDVSIFHFVGLPDFEFDS